MAFQPRIRIGSRKLGTRVSTCPHSRLCRLRPWHNWGSRMNLRFLMAMACYSVLALLAAFTLDETPRIVVWLILGAFAVKTWIAKVRKDRGLE